jgi:hypothetical protein
MATATAMGRKPPRRSGSTHLHSFLLSAVCCPLSAACCLVSAIRKLTASRLRVRSPGGGSFVWPLSVLCLPSVCLSAPLSWLDREAVGPATRGAGGGAENQHADPCIHRFTRGPALCLLSFCFFLPFICRLSVRCLSVVCLLSAVYHVDSCVRRLTCGPRVMHDGGEMIVVVAEMVMLVVLGCRRACAVGSA